MRFEATFQSSTRIVLKRLSAAVNLAAFTDLLQVDCTALEYESGERGMTLNFCMRDYHKANALQAIVAGTFPKLKKLYQQEADTCLFNIRVTSPKE